MSLSKTNTSKAASPLSLFPLATGDIIEIPENWGDRFILQAYDGIHRAAVCVKVNGKNKWMPTSILGNILRPGNYPTESAEYLASSCSNDYDRLKHIGGRTLQITGFYTGLIVCYERVPNERKLDAHHPKHHWFERLLRRAGLRKIPAISPPVYQLRQFPFFKFI